MASTHIAKSRVTSFSHRLHRRFLHSSQSHQNALSTAVALRNPARSNNFTRQLHSSVKRPQLLPPTSKALMTASFFSLLGSLFSSSARAEDNMAYPDKRTDEEWRAVLSPEQFRVIRGKGTEAPYTGTYDKHYPSKGVYNCAACDAPLYQADTKFKSGCGWPAYFDALPGAVTRHVDSTLGMERIEIVCSNCGGHLGHVFKGEGFPTPTDERHCVNSVSLKFNEDESGANGDKNQESKV